MDPLRPLALRGITALCAAVDAIAGLFAAPPAKARDGYIIQDGRAPIDYTAEIEPHLVFGSAPPGRGAGSGVGIGARASLVVAPDGFIRGSRFHRHRLGRLRRLRRPVRAERVPQSVPALRARSRRNDGLHGRHLQRRQLQLRLHTGGHAVELLAD